MFLRAGVARIYSPATLQQSRGQGIGSALTVAPFLRRPGARLPRRHPAVVGGRVRREGWGLRPIVQSASMTPGE